MKIFLDTADTKTIGKHFETGLIDGVTTNPTLIMKSHERPDDVYRDLVSLFTLAFSTLGSVGGEKLSDVFVEGKSLGDVPIRKVEIANIGKENFNADEMSFEHFQRQEQILKAKFARRMKTKKDNIAQAQI